MRNAMKSNATVIDINGMKHYLGDIDAPLYHTDTLDDYIEKNYSHEEMFDLLYENNSKDMYAYILGLCGDIVYLNGKTFGVLYLPQDINEKQKNSLDELALELEGISVTVKYNQVYMGSFVSSEFIETTTLKEELKHYFEGEKHEENRQL